MNAVQKQALVFNFRLWSSEQQKFRRRIIMSSKISTQSRIFTVLVE